MVKRQINIGKGLGFDALGCVHDKERSVAGSQGTGNFVIEVNVSRGVDKVQNIVFPVFVRKRNTHGLGFDCDAPFSFQIHIVKVLVFFFTVADKIGKFQNPVRQRGFAVVDVRNDGEVSDMF